MLPPRDPDIAVQEEYEAEPAIRQRPIGFSSPGVRARHLPQRRKRGWQRSAVRCRSPAFLVCYGEGSNNSVRVIAERGRGCFQLKLNDIS